MREYFSSDMSDPRWQLVLQIYFHQINPPGMLSESFLPENLKTDAIAVHVLNMSVKIVLMSLCGGVSLTSFYSYLRWR